MHYKDKHRREREKFNFRAFLLEHDFRHRDGSLGLWRKSTQITLLQGGRMCIHTTIGFMKVNEYTETLERVDCLAPRNITQAWALMELLIEPTIFEGVEPKRVSRHSA